MMQTFVMLCKRRESWRDFLHGCLVDGYHKVLGRSLFHLFIELGQDPPECLPEDEVGESDASFTGGLGSSFHADSQDAEEREVDTSPLRRDSLSRPELGDQSSQSSAVIHMSPVKRHSSQRKSKRTPGRQKRRRSSGTLKRCVRAWTGSGVLYPSSFLLQPFQEEASCRTPSIAPEDPNQRRQIEAGGSRHTVLAIQSAAVGAGLLEGRREVARSDRRTGVAAQTGWEGASPAAQQHGSFSSMRCFVTFQLIFNSVEHTSPSHTRRRGLILPTPFHINCSFQN